MEATKQTSTLRQVLTRFEQAQEAVSLPEMARDLDLPLVRLEMMIQYWVRKGKIREVYLDNACGTCGAQEGCPFVLEMPRSYELSTQGEAVPLTVRRDPCKF